MFQVVDMETGSICTVYGVNGVRFLIWNQEGETPHWEWMEMQRFRPVKN